MKSLVVGAGIAGLSSALVLSRQGHEVTIVEQDDMDPASATAFPEVRQGIPQGRHSHGYVARMRNLLRDRYPDVLQAVMAAGGTEVRMTDYLPSMLDDTSEHPGDEDLVVLGCRRTVYERVLREIVLSDPLVQIRGGVHVAGLVGAPGSPPVVTGVRLNGGETLEGDMIVLAGGPRLGVREWLAALDVTVAEREVPVPIVYVSRFYRLRAGQAFPPHIEPGILGIPSGCLGFFAYFTWPADDGTFSVTTAVPVSDRDLRMKLRDPTTFDRACLTVPDIRPWVERSEPISDVAIMAGLMNRTRHFTDGDGQPLVLGLHAVGDTHMSTNPAYGRGCSLALVQAGLLADATEEHGTDPLKRAIAYEAAFRQEIEPWFDFAVQSDAMFFFDGSPDIDPGQAALLIGMRDAFVEAIKTDSTVLRAWWRTYNLLVGPDAFFSDPEVTDKVTAILTAGTARRPGSTPELASREAFLAAAGASPVNRSGR